MDQTLKQLIGQTALFSPNEKVDLLVLIDSMTDTQKKGLTDVIKVYNKKHNQLGQQFKKSTLDEFHSLSSQSGDSPSIRQAGDLMKKGLDALYPDPPSSQ